MLHRRHPKKRRKFLYRPDAQNPSESVGSRIVVSYADLEYGHEGTIYKASNFKMVGKIKGARVIMFDGKRYHDKTIRTKYNGDLKPYAKRIRAALEAGEAFYKTTAGKMTYIYQL